MLELCIDSANHHTHLLLTYDTWSDPSKGGFEMPRSFVAAVVIGKRLSVPPNADFVAKGEEGKN